MRIPRVVIDSFWDAPGVEFEPETRNGCVWPYCRSHRGVSHATDRFATLHFSVHDMAHGTVKIHTNGNTTKILRVHVNGRGKISRPYAKVLFTLYSYRFFFWPCITCLSALSAFWIFFSMSSLICPMLSRLLASNFANKLFMSSPSSSSAELL